MRYVNLALASTLTVLAALMSPAPAAAQQVDSGLRCRFSPGSPMVAGEIDCTVTADQVTVQKVTFNRGNCPARFDDARAERQYYEFWSDTPENRAWWANTNYHRTYPFGARLHVEASGQCGSLQLLEFEVVTERGAFTWTVTR